MPTDPLVNTLSEDSVVNTASAVASYLVSKFSHDDARLLQEPLQTLTPLFIRGLNKIADQHPIVLFVDRYQDVDSFITPWLINILSLESVYGSLPHNLTIVLTGTTELDYIQWSTYEDFILRLQINPFSAKEVEDYLSTKGINDIETANIIMKITGGLPIMVATLINGLSGNGTISEGKNFVEFYFRNLTDQDALASLLTFCAPRRLTPDIIHYLFPEDDSDEYYRWFREKSFINDSTLGTIKIHDVIRPLFVSYFRGKFPLKWRSVQESMAAYYEAKSKQVLEALAKRERRTLSSEDYLCLSDYIYHKLFIEETAQSKIAKAINAFSYLLGHQEGATMWANAVSQAGNENEDNMLKAVGEKLTLLVSSLANDDLDGATSSLNWLISNPFTERKVRLSWIAARCIVHLNSLRFFEAYNDAQTLVVDAPTNKAYMRLKADSLHLLGNYFEAIEQYGQISKISGTESFHGYMAELQIAKCYESLLDLNAAIEVLSNLQCLRPKNPSAFLTEAVMLTEDGQYNAALDKLDYAQSLSPDWGAIYLERGRIYLFLGQYEEASEDLSLSLKRDGVLKERLYYSLAALYQRQEKWEESFTICCKSLDIDSTQEAWYCLLSFLYKNSMDDNQIYLTIKEYKFFKEETRLIADLCNALIEHKKFSLALKFIEGLPLKKHAPIIHYIKGLIYIFQHHTRQALNEFEISEKGDPYRHHVKFQKGNCYEEWGRYRRSLIEFNQARKLFPNDKDILIAVARSQIAAGLKDEAKTTLDEIVSKGLNSSAATTVGLLYTYIDQFEQALVIYEDFCNRDEVSTSYNLAIAYAKYYGLFSCEQAVKKAEVELQSVYVSGDVSIAAYGLAGLRAVQGSHTDALAMLEKAISMSETPNLIKRWAKFDRAFDEIRELPKFSKLIEIKQVED